MDNNIKTLTGAGKSLQELTHILKASAMSGSTSKLWLLYLMCTCIGSACFGLGFYIGFNAKGTVLQTIKNQSIAITSGAKKEEKKFYNYLVHVGLYSTADYAQAAWKDIADYSKLDEKQAISKTMINKKPFYQVVAGSFEDQASAKTFADLIQSRNTEGIVPIVKRIPATENTIPVSTT